MVCAKDEKEKGAEKAESEELRDRGRRSSITANSSPVSHGFLKKIKKSLSNS